MTFTLSLRHPLLLILALAISHYSASLVGAQTNSPVPAKPAESEAVQDSLKVFIEEVLIPISATDASGHLDPSVILQDLMLKEDGVQQQLKSVYRIPANVLFLLDTGTTPNSTKDVRLTKAVVHELAASLQPEDRVAMIQVNHRVELLQEWTSDRAAALQSIDKKLLPGRESALVAGIIAAVKQFQSVPSGNSHIVFITDGNDRATTQTRFSDALQNLVPANVTVHIISYTSLQSKRKDPIPTRPRVKSAVDKHLIAALPSTRFKEDPTPDLKTLMETKGGVVLDIDLLFSRNGKKNLKQREREFFTVAEETGGSLWLPSSPDKMVDCAPDVARVIDSQYVISYKPSRPLSTATATEYRKIDVISRRVGLNVRARRGYVASRIRNPGL